MASKPNDEKLLALIEAHKTLLYKVANVYCRRKEDRADLIQEIVVQLWRSFDKFDETLRFSTWTYRIAMNVAISFYRREKSRSRETLQLEDVELELGAADRALEQCAEVAELHRRIRQLEELDRAIVLLYLEGNGNEMIGEVLGMPATNVATRLTRIRQKLQRDYEALEKKVGT